MHALKMLESILLEASPQQFGVHQHAGQLMGSRAEQLVLRSLWATLCVSPDQLQPCHPD